MIFILCNLFISEFIHLMNSVLYGLLNIPYHLESQSHCVLYSYNIQNKRENILLRVSLYKVDKQLNVFFPSMKVLLLFI